MTNKSVWILPLFAVTAAVALAATPAPSAPTGPAQTGRSVRTTDLRATASATATLVEVVPANAELQVFERQGGWYRVKHAGKDGWVRLTAVRFASATPSSGSGGLTASLGFLRSGRSAAQTGTVTTGVRGLSETDLQNAVPDEAAVDRLDGLAVPKADAESQARDLGLRATTVEFLKPVKDDDDKDGKDSKDKEKSKKHKKQDAEDEG